MYTQTLDFPISRTKPCFPWICFTQALEFHPRFLETPDNSNQVWLLWDKLTLDNSNLLKFLKHLVRMQPLQLLQQQRVMTQRHNKTGVSYKISQCLISRLSYRFSRN